MPETFARTVPGEAHPSHAHHPQSSFFWKYIWSEDHRSNTSLRPCFFCWSEVRLPWASAFSWPSRVLPFL
jgi:hypothetical protein